ncbi:MAG: SAM-dependent methyltransferase [Pseudonocardia sp.]|nr:SAM-dependent methyltransferase [Pseudonocardia sp.]
MADVESDDRRTEIEFNKPNSARIWNYWMGGKDNYEIDQEVGDAYAEVFPGITTWAKQARQFIIRSVRYMAEAGVRQFLDIGTGFPVVQNTHEVAQSVAPDAKIVYVDNDPVVLAHARALLTTTTDEGVCAFVDADLRDTDQVIAAAREILNFNQPIAVMFNGVLGHIENYDEVLAVVGRYMSAVPSGSYLEHYDGSDADPAYPRALAQFVNTEDNAGWGYHARTPEQIKQLFDGLELVEPGVVRLSEWRPDLAARVGSGQAVDVVSMGGVGRKP